MLDAAERHRRALALKVQGLTHEEIAGELGYASRGAVTDAIKAGVREAVLPTALEYRSILTERLERLYRAAHAKAIGDDGQLKNLDAFDRCVRIVQRLESLLGLGGRRLMVGQDPEADPVGIDAKVSVDGTVELLGRLTSEELQQLADLRDRLVSRLGSPAAGVSDGESGATIGADSTGPHPG
jgi:hypothetical protein